ncbi:glycosyltransferase family 2 protein [Butyrivibrio sp. FCS006]|uniref:glycosyltransferase family 2 protein n=1 Tax=Butyrivibrio sp. FCS006 TaxID=1280684 RepID=UPI00041714CF|nr:glycosyltransferase family A protein [Butyrivibrio sp. FCS006]
MTGKNDFKTSTEYGLSIIIPTYNAEAYLAECLESILKQVSDDSVEIICIDDGSEDGTTELLERYGAKYKNIRFLSKNHEGAWAARNLGISVATKKYISFLDADDYYEVDAISKIYESCVNSEEDVIGFAHWKILDNHDIRDEKIVDFSEDLIIPANGKKICVSEWQCDYGYTNFVFNRRFIRENNIMFPPYMRYEDPVFLLKALKGVDSFRLFPVSIYVCRVGYKNSSEIDKTIIDVLRGIRDNLSASYDSGFEMLRETLLERIDDEFYEPIYRGLADETMKVLLEISEINSRFEHKREIRVLSDIYHGLAGKMISERNYTREQDIIRDYRIFNDVTECMKKNGGFSKALADNGIENVCIYGAGLYGRLLVQEFLLHGIQIKAVIDRNNDGSVEGMEVKHPDDGVPDSDLIIVALRNASSVIDSYRKQGIYNIIGIQDLADKIIRCQNKLF